MNNRNETQSVPPIRSTFKNYSSNINDHLVPFTSEHGLVNTLHLDPTLENNITNDQKDDFSPNNSAFYSWNTPSLSSSITMFPYFEEPSNEDYDLTRDLELNEFLLKKDAVNTLSFLELN